MVTDASIPREAAPYMGVLMSELLHGGNISDFLRNEPTESLWDMKQHIRQSEPLLQLFQVKIGLPLDGPSWWVSDVLPTIDHEIRRRRRPKPIGGSRIAEIKASLDLLDVAQRYTQMTRCGPGKWKGKCPLHEENTPSFLVYEDTQRYWCFGACASGGDVIDLLAAKGASHG